MASMLLEPYSLVSIAARSFILLTLTAGMAFAFRRRSAAVLHGIWAVGLGGCLAIPVVMWLSPSWFLPLLPPEASDPSPTRDVAAGSRLATPASTPESTYAGNGRPVGYQPPTLTGPPETTPTNTSYEGRMDTQSATTAVASWFEWPTLRSMAMAIWAAGVLVVLLRLLQQMVGVKRKLREADDVDRADWFEQRDIAAQLLGLRANVTLRRHPELLSPMVAGLFRPVVLLPDDADTWSHKRRKLVLLHELAHVQRRDVLTQTMATLTCSIYWFNPLVWCAASQMIRLREIACDDAVITRSGVAATYAQTLLDVAKRYRCQRLMTAVAMARSSNVETRITAILSPTRSRDILTKRSVRAFAAVALAVAAFVGTCQLSSRADDSTEDKPDQVASPEESTESRTMVVRVLDSAGQPLSNANIHVSIWEMPDAKDYPNQNYTTDEEGRAEVAMPRRLQILRMWPAKAGYVRMFVNFARGKHREGRLIPDEYEFRLEKGHRLSGRVVDEDGDPISNAKVRVSVEVDERAWGVNPDAIVSTRLGVSDIKSPIPVTDADGRWSIDSAPAPRDEGDDYEFRLQVGHPDFAGDTRWGELQRRQGITTADLRAGTATLTLERGIAITGVVTGPDGEAVRDGLVIWSDRPYWAEGVNETRIDDEGHYTTKRLAPGEYPITVLAPGFAPTRRTIKLKQNMEAVNFRLEAGKRLRIKLVDQQGNPISKGGIGIGEWRGTEAIYNEKHPNVPDSGIPRFFNAEGIYEWDWAPKDAVTYRIGAKGYAPQELTLVAKAAPHVVTLAPSRVVVGTVTDAVTGKPVERFQAIPVIVFRPDFYHTRTTDAKEGRAGSYDLPLTGSGNPDDRYRVRFEADGYRSVVSEESFGPLDGRATLDLALEPAPARSGQVIDAEGRPVEGATVLEASATMVPDTSNGEPRSYDTRPAVTDADGNIELHATTEATLIRVYDDRGFAEKTVAAEDDAIGVMQLAPWSTVSGQLVQAGRPIGEQSIYFQAFIQRGLREPRFQDSFQAQTDVDGRFHFRRLPPIGGSIRASLGPWQDSPLASSEALPLVLEPGEHREIILGGEGATVNGRVVATGRSNDELSKQWSLNYLVSRDRSVDDPRESAALRFDAVGALQADWLRQPDFQSWVATRLNYFVKLADDGQLRIHGVEAGVYDLVVQLYEEPAGCLVETIGETVVPLTVTAEQAASGEVEIGDVVVNCRIGPRVGSDMRVFKFTDAGGRVRHVDDMKGRYVLLHAWATWCTPCLASMPLLKASAQHYSNARLTVVGLNVDEDADAARAMAADKGMDWSQNYLGADSELMRQLAVSTVPAYYLIGPDGKLVGSANRWEQMETLLSGELR